jgi:hypothetical protein
MPRGANKKNISAGGIQSCSKLFQVIRTAIYKNKLDAWTVYKKILLKP